MGRRPLSSLTALGWRLQDRMRALGLEAPEVAAAAGISASTLYRIMRADRRGTAEPRLATKRRLALALRTSMASLFDDPQFEFVHEPQPSLEPTSIEALVLHHMRSIPEELQLDATRAAALALVDVVLSVSGNNPPIADQLVSGLTGVPSEDLLLILLHSLPGKMQRVGAKAAISAMLKVERLAGGEPSKAAYASITRTNWSEKRIARDRPPLADLRR